MATFPRSPFKKYESGTLIQLQDLQYAIRPFLGPRRRVHKEKKSPQKKSVFYFMLAERCEIWHIFFSIGFLHENMYFLGTPFYIGGITHITKKKMRPSNQT